MQVGVLGRVVATAGGEDLALGGPKQRTVLALLVAGSGNPVSIDKMFSGVFGDDAAGGPRRTIHTYVSNLRGAFGDAVIRSADGDRINPVIMSVDAVEFEEQLGRGSGLLDASPSQASETLRDALALWRGRPYADIDARSVLDGEIVRLQELRLGAIESRIEADLALGAHRSPSRRRRGSAGNSLMTSATSTWATHAPSRSPSSRIRSREPRATKRQVTAFGGL